LRLIGPEIFARRDVLSEGPSAARRGGVPEGRRGASSPISDDVRTAGHRDRPSCAAGADAVGVPREPVRVIEPSSRSGLDQEQSRPDVGRTSTAGYADRMTTTEGGGASASPFMRRIRSASPIVVV